MSKSKMQWTQYYLRSTTCKYTVVIQCCDPPIPAFYFNTNSEKAARKLFKELKEEEIEQLGGGEFTITLYEHEKQTKPTYHRLSAEEGDYDHPYVYGIFYPEAKTLDEFSYMDLIRMGDELAEARIKEDEIAKT